MSLKERKDRRLRDMSSMYQNTRGGWAKRVLSDIIRSSKKDDLIYVGTGWGLNYRIGGYGKSFIPLDIDTLVQKVSTQLPVSFVTRQTLYVPVSEKI